ncbi:hypothetical protein [Burkholderia ubonensis]|nr:hypothetical protein [Burkholderia ubonensis]
MSPTPADATRVMAVNNVVGIVFVAMLLGILCIAVDLNVTLAPK